jgi:hypothetical protein
MHERANKRMPARLLIFPPRAADWQKNREMNVMINPFYSVTKDTGANPEGKI